MKKLGIFFKLVFLVVLNSLSFSEIKYLSE